MAEGIRSVHRRAGIFMVSTKQLTVVMRGITAAHIKEHGSGPLLPNRKDPIGLGLYRQIPNTPEGTKLGSKQPNWRGPLFLRLGAMFTLSESMGFRKSEVALPNGEDFDDWRLRRSSLLWEIGETPHAGPSPELLRTAVPGRDKAVIQPPRSKSDQDGTIRGAHPIWLIFDPADVANAEECLQQIELQFPCRGPKRPRTPLFFSTAKFASMPEDRVKACSFHSFWTGFACALLVTNCPCGMVQALARCRSDRSVAACARLSPDDYSTWVSTTLQQKTTSRTTARLPVVTDDHGAVETFQLAGTYSRQAAADVAEEYDIADTE